MKEIMLPYILLIWLLVKTGVMPWNLKTQFWSVSIGALIATLLFAASRFWAPVDLTNATTVRAPQAVLSPAIQQQVDQIFVTHNQMVKKGDLIYSLVDTTTESEVQALDQKITALRATIKASEVAIENDKLELQRQQKLGKFTSQQMIDNLVAKISSAEATNERYEADIKELEARKISAEYQNNLKQIRAPFDGQISLVNIAEGTRIGNMHLYDTSKKFVEMRIPDQAYAGVEQGRFAEFYVDAYPGHIFRGRVHSVLTGTGEASISTLQGDQSVRRFVGANMSSHGRTVIIEFDEPEGYNIPIGATGSGWISNRKPTEMIGFIDIIGGATVRLNALKAYLTGM